MAVSGAGLTELSPLGVMGRTRTIAAKTEASANFGGDWYIVQFRHRGIRSILFSLLMGVKAWLTYRQ